MSVGLWLLTQLVTWITYGHTIPVENGKINLMSPYMSVKSVWWSQVFEITQQMYQEETYYRTGCFWCVKVSYVRDGRSQGSISAYPAKTVNENDWSIVFILFSVHQQNIIKTSQPKPIRTALTYETMPRSSCSSIFMHCYRTINIHRNVTENYWSEKKEKQGSHLLQFINSICWEVIHRLLQGLPSSKPTKKDAIASKLAQTA